MYINVSIIFNCILRKLYAESSIVTMDNHNGTNNGIGRYATCERLLLKELNDVRAGGGGSQLLRLKSKSQCDDSILSLYH